MSTAIRIDRLDKNYLINGGFDFFRRVASNAITNISTTPAYVSPDRFKVSYTGTVTGTPAVQQVSNTMSSGKAKWAIQYTARRNSSSLSLNLEQRVEGVEARELAVAGTGAFSIQVFSPIAGATIQLTLNYPTAEDNYSSFVQFFQSTGSVISASTWTQVTFTGITIPANAVNGISAQVSLVVPSGTDGSSQNYLFTQIHLSSGITTPVFTRHGKNISDELRACGRFLAATPGTTGSPFAAGSFDNNGILAPWLFPVQMRTVPTVNFANVSVTNPQLGTYSVASVSSVTAQWVSFWTVSASIGTSYAGRAGYLGDGGGIVTADAEL